jgi:hypothetical protein
VRSQCPGGGVHDLEFLFDADGEAMRHAAQSSVGGGRCSDRRK